MVSFCLSGRRLGGSPLDIHYQILAVFCCLRVFFCSLHRGLAVIADLGGVLRFSVGRRLLPLWLSLCFPLRGVGFIVALR